MILSQNWHHFLFGRNYSFKGDGLSSLHLFCWRSEIWQSSSGGTRWLSFTLPPATVSKGLCQVDGLYHHTHTPHGQHIRFSAFNQACAQTLSMSLLTKSVSVTFRVETHWVCMTPVNVGKGLFVSGIFVQKWSDKPEMVDTVGWLNIAFCAPYCCTLKHHL